MANNPANLEISKTFDCSKETLYKAWTEPEQLKQWWKPMGKHLTDVTNNIKEGGEVRYTFEDGSLNIDGQYEKVVEHDTLEYTWNWHVASEQVEDASYRLSVSFKGDESQSSISIRQAGFENAESVLPHREGWQQGLQQLETYLSAGTSKNENADNGKQKPPISGYNETPEQQKVGGG